VAKLIVMLIHSAPGTLVWPAAMIVWGPGFRSPAHSHHSRQNIGTSDDFSLKKLAAVSGLSQSRFMHVFTESIGVPLRPYFLWLRLQRAACELMDGQSVTHAAHGAGFSDAAHLTRTFRRMLGTTPTDLAFRKRMSSGTSADLLKTSRSAAANLAK